MQPTLVADPDPDTDPDTAADDERRQASLRTLEQEMGVLVRRIRRVIGERAKAVHESLQPSSFLMLSYVAEEGPLRASTMVECFDIDKGAVSRQVQHLLELGLLVGEPDPADRRAVLLSATPEATRRLADVVEHRRKHLDEQLGGWSPDELEEFVSDLGRYNTSLGRE